MRYKLDTLVWVKYGNTKITANIRGYKTFNNIVESYRVRIHGEIYNVHPSKVSLIRGVKQFGN